MSELSAADIAEGHRPHPDCWGPRGHICQKPSGRVCVDCGAPAGTWWGPYWCPDCDVKRLAGASNSLAEIAKALEARTVSSNEPRDQLAAIAKRIRSQAVISARPGQLDALEQIANDLAALELEFVGWRPPSRVIETASALRHERHGTVIRFRDGTVAAVDTADGHWPGRVMTLENPVDYWHLSEGDMELFPAVVLHEPEEAVR